MKHVIAFTLAGLAAGALALAGLVARGDRAVETRARAMAELPMTPAAADTGVLQRAAEPNGAQAMQVGSFRSSGGRVFTLDRSGDARAWLVFEDTGEVLPLTESWGRGGDVVLLDEDGRVALRLTARGNAILYAGRDELGEPADAIATEQAEIEAPSLKPAG